MKTSYVLDFEDVMIDVTSHFKKIDTNQYGTTGATPIVDQSANDFCGYTDIQPEVASISPPYIIFGDHTRRFKFVDEDFVLGADGTKVLKTKINADHKYLFHFFKSIKLEEAGYSRHYKFLKRTKLFVPPLAEQQRIAALLDTADRVLKLRESAIDKLDQLAQSVFVEMFGSFQNFENKKLSEVCDLITDGTHYTPTYVDNGVVFLSAKNVTKGTVDWNRVKYVPESLHIELQKRVSPKIGDILLAKNGTTGVAAIVDRDVVFDIYVSLALLRPKDLVDKTFLHAALNSTLTKRQFNSALKGIGVPNLHLVEIRKVTIPVPSVNEQKKFVEILDKINNLKTYFLKSELLIKNKISSLQHQSFAVN